MLTVKDIYDKRFSKDDFLFFWGHTGQGKACLSQWYPSPFVIGGVYYNCSEQYMMAEKARIFGDVMMNLWEASDIAIECFMTNFYFDLVHGSKDRHEAFEFARNETRKNIPCLSIGQDS